MDWTGGFGQNVLIREYKGSENLRGERFFAERDSSRRDSLRGQTSPRRESLRGEVLQGETLSMERTAEEREALRRDSLRGETSPRRDGLQGEDVSVERLFEERETPGRTRTRSCNLNLIVTANHFGIRNGISSSPNQYLEKNEPWTCTLHSGIELCGYLRRPANQTIKLTNYRVHCLPISHRHDFSVAFDATLSDATLSDATGWYSSSSRRTLSSK